MTAFDYAFLVVACLSILLGLWRGLIVELFALAAWVVAFVAARLCAPVLAPHMAQWISAPWLQIVVAFVAVFVLVLIVMALLRLLVRELLAAVGLSVVDRLLGACFGALRAAVLSVLIVGAAGMTSLPREPWWCDAVFAPPLETAVIAAKPWLPPELARRIKYR